MSFRHEEEEKTAAGQSTDPASRAAQARTCDSFSEFALIRGAGILHSWFLPLHAQRLVQYFCCGTYIHEDKCAVTSIGLHVIGLLLVFLCVTAPDRHRL